jgi:hypothetical protein
VKKRALVVLVGVVMFAAVAWADEKEDLQWKLRALVAELNSAQQQLPQFKALQEFGKELDSKGLVVKDGKIVDKPKPQTPAPKAEPKAK